MVTLTEDEKALFSRLGIGDGRFVGCSTVDESAKKLAKK
jgi:hypothetical protein